MSKTARRLVKGSSLRILFYVVQVCVSMVLAPYIVHSLGDRMYGLWTLIVTFIGYYGLLDLGLSFAVNRYVSEAIGTKEIEKCNRIFNTALILFLYAGAAALLLSIILAVLSPVFVSDSQNSSLFYKIVLILGFNMALELPLRAYLGILTSQLRFDLLSILELITLTLRTILIVIVLSNNYGILGLAIVTVISGLPQKFMTVVFAKKSMPTIRYNIHQFKWTTAKTLIGYSYYSFLWKIADILKFHVDVVVISTMLSLSAVTHYRIGSLLALHMQSFMGAMLGFMLPVFSRLYGEKDQSGIKKTFFFVNKISIYISCFISFGFIFWGRPFITLWMGASYTDAYPVLCILVIASLIAYLQVPAIEILMGTNEFKYVGNVNVIEGVCKLILSLILVRSYGIVGVALGTLIPMAIIKLFIQPIYVVRCLSVTYGELFLKIGKSIAIGFGALIIPGILSILYIQPSYGVLMILGSVSFTIYFVSIWFLGFNQEELRNIRNTILPTKSTEDRAII